MGNRSSRLALGLARGATPGLLLVLISACGQVAPGAPPGLEPLAVPRAVPEDFALRYGYGVCIDHTFDEVDGTFTRSLSGEQPVQVELSLTAEERDAIYREVVRIDLFSYPEEIAIDLREIGPVSMVVPFLRNQLEVRVDGRWKRGRWTEEVVEPLTEPMANVRSLGQMIRDLLERKRVVREMPQPHVACL